MTTRVVFDTNIRISAIIFKGRPLEVISRTQPPEFQQIISPALLDELYDVLLRKFRWTETAISNEIEIIHQNSLCIVPDITIEACRDPDDNRVLECAVAGKATSIVTGDSDLLVLTPFRNISILTLRQFLDTLPR